jgi:hypothetical protein
MLSIACHALHPVHISPYRSPCAPPPRCVPFTSYKPKPEASGLHLPADQEPPAKKRRTAGPSSGGRRQVNPDAALAEVWGTAGGAMDGLRADERELGRSLQDFVSPVFYALDEAVEEGWPQASVAAGLDQVYMWRLQRQLPRHHLELFMAQQVGGWLGGALGLMHGWLGVT